MERKTMTTTKCLVCQLREHKEEKGFYPIPNAERHISMWGCSCDPEVEQEALQYMEMMTR